MTDGLSPLVLVALRMLVAAILISPFAIVLERNTRPKMTFPIFAKIVLLSLFEPVLSQNLYYTGMKYTTATYTVAMCNILPAMAFIMAWIFGLEIVKISKVHSQAKILGTIVAVGGAMIMTFVKGSLLELPWTNGRTGVHNKSGSDMQDTDLIKGAVMIIAGCFFWSCFIILQAFILKSYPSELSLTALVCTLSSVEGVILAFAVERGNTKIWSIFNPDVKLLAGMVSCTAYFIMGWLMKKRGPVFVSSFNPLGMVIIAVLSSFLLAEKLFLGRVIGATVIVIGLYMILWGKSKERRCSKSQNSEDAGAQNGQQMGIMNGDIETPSHESSVTVDNRQRPEEDSI
ncbi:hypothetical protein Patl1_06293 [Pistacia atlantica]|uniref:Uncharacterized protein n=1 Tax=Pistacia atlantica TaxID=434234 RepID=A0ACC1BSG0_9ROSI|nr:hypothetical protein Patl1_06293 [Pistacia atlantica]